MALCVTRVLITAALMLPASAIANAAERASAEMGVSATVIASVYVKEATNPSGDTSLRLSTDATPVLKVDEGIDVSYDGNAWAAVAFATAADEPLYVTLIY